MKVTVQARIVRQFPREKVLVKTFHVYDSNDPKDKEGIKMRALLAENPTYEALPFQQSGPCSNWGYDVFRPETDEEYTARIAKLKRR